MTFPRLAAPARFLPVLFLLFSTAPLAAAEPVAVNGRVVSSMYEPVADARVELLPLAADAALNATPTVEARSEADGRFRVLAPGPGAWRLVVRAPGVPAMGLDLLLVEAVELPRLWAPPGRELRVRVTGPGGRPVAGAEVFAIPRIPRMEETARPRWSAAPAKGATGPDGQILLVSAAADLALTVRAPGFPLSRQDVAQGVPEAEIRLAPGTGRVVEARGADGEPVPGVAVLSAEGDLLLGRTDDHGRLPLLAPRAAPMALRLLAPDGRWAEVEVRPAASPEEAEPAVVGILQPPAVIPGTVRDRFSGAPARRSLVLAAAGGSALASAPGDGLGRFEIPVPFGVTLVDLRAAAPGYAAETVEPARGGRETEVRLSPTRSVTGLVEGPAGSPVAGAVVLLSSEPAPDGSTEVSRRASARPDGRFVVDHLDPGTYRLAAEAPGFAPTFRSGVKVEAGVSAVDLGTIPLEREALVEGRVVDPEGLPIEGARLWPRLIGRTWMGVRQDEEDVSAVVSRADGGFTIPGLRAGERLHHLNVSRDGFARQRLRNVPVPSPEPLVITLQPGVRVSGRVLDERGRPVEGARVKVSSISRERGFSSMGTTGTTDAQGYFGTEDLRPEGSLEIEASALGFVPAKLQDIEVPEDGEVKELRLVLRRGSVVEGRVTDPGGQPVAGAEVALKGSRETLPWERNGPVPGRAATDPEGRFRLDGVPEGRQSLTVRKEGFLPEEAELDVHPGSNRLDLPLDRGGTVDGRVVSRDGPVEGATIRVHPGVGPRSSFEPPPTYRSAEDGSFRISAFPPGRFRVSASKPGLGTREVEVPIAGSETVQVEIRLEAGATIRGRILGLAPRDLQQVKIGAHGPRSARGWVDNRGEYEIRDLGPGHWFVQASLGSGFPMRHAQTQVEIAEGETEVWVDLDFSSEQAPSGERP